MGKLVEHGEAMARVTGIGGVFFKSTGDSAALAEWYRKHLGLQLESFGGAIFRWPDDKAEDRGVTVWSVAKATSKWFHPSDAQFMINYRVDDLDAVISALKAEGCNVLEKTMDSDYGKFGWVIDPEGNKIELWQPAPSQ